jgi:hypothetical protein
MVNKMREPDVPLGGVAIAWKRVRLLFAVLALIRFSILIPAVLIVTLLVSDQMTDALVAVADDRSPVASSSLLITTLFAALIVWYTARTMLRFKFDSNPASNPAAYPSLKRQLPRLLAILVPVALLAKVLTLLQAVGDKGSILQIVFGLAVVAAVTGLYVTQRRNLARIRHLEFLAKQESEERRELRQLAALPSLTRGVFWILIAGNVTAIALALWAPLRAAAARTRPERCNGQRAGLCRQSPSHSDFNHAYSVDSVLEPLQ